jgi:hypothetical protein
MAGKEQNLDALSDFWIAPQPTKLSHIGTGIAPLPPLWYKVKGPAEPSLKEQENNWYYYV